MKLNNFLVLAEDLLTLLKKDEDLWFEIWEAENERRSVNKEISKKILELEK